MGLIKVIRIHPPGTTNLYEIFQSGSNDVVLIRASDQNSLYVLLVSGGELQTTYSVQFIGLVGWRIRCRSDVASFARATSKAKAKPSRLSLRIRCYASVFPGASTAHQDGKIETFSKAVSTPQVI